ncbi:MAG: hypothetical protein IT290_12075, partial [Deltaproteobacteria bacterium]|nr:hypothetical protein [Deltaproteobacteria bacterium]
SKHDPSLVAHGRALNEFVLQTIARGTDSSADPNIVGAVAGSAPFDGGYCQSSYPNWATKFFIDSMLSELANGNEAQTQDPRDQS